MYHERGKIQSGMYNTYMAIEPMCIKFLAINPFDVAHIFRGAFMCFDEALVSECLCGPLPCIVHTNQEV